MKKTLISILSIAFALIITSCNKNKDLINPPTGISASPDSYQPMTAGSTWTYNMDMGSSTDVLTIKMTGKTMDLNGKKYYEATSVSKVGGSQIGYFHQTGSVYGTRGQSAQAQAIVDLDFLDLSKPVDGTWEIPLNQAGQINGFAGKTKYKLVEKNVSKVIGGKTFNNVMHTKIELQYDLGFGSGMQTYADYDYFVAKGIGMIELDTYFSGALLVKQTIATYDIK